MLLTQGLLVKKICYVIFFSLLCKIIREKGYFV